MDACSCHGFGPFVRFGALCGTLDGSNKYLCRSSLFNLAGSQAQASDQSTASTFAEINEASKSLTQGTAHALPHPRTWICHLAMGHNLWLHFGVDEHPLATHFDVHQGFPGFCPAISTVSNFFSGFAHLLLTAEPLALALWFAGGHRGHLGGASPSFSAGSVGPGFPAEPKKSLSSRRDSHRSPSFPRVSPRIPLVFP